MHLFVFAGDTSWAYPLMHQVISAISTYERSASRAQDIVELKSHVLKVFESLRQAVHDASGDEGIPSAEFLFGGYSWIRKKFMIWRIHFQKGMNSFEANPAKEWKGNPWIFAGDKDHVEQAREDLSTMMKSRRRAPHQVDKFKFDWEPFEVIRDMLRKLTAQETSQRGINWWSPPSAEDLRASKFKIFGNRLEDQLSRRRRRGLCLWAKNSWI